MCSSQFLDHDITLTPETHVDGDGCCTDNAPEDCFAIHIPDGDPFYSDSAVQQTCLEFTRSEEFCAEQDPEMREQFNGITAFVDASNVYGSDKVTNDRLRTGQDVRKENLIFLEPSCQLPPFPLPLPGPLRVRQRRPAP